MNQKQLWVTLLRSQNLIITGIKISKFASRNDENENDSKYILTHQANYDPLVKTRFFEVALGRNCSKLNNKIEIVSGCNGND